MPPAGSPPAIPCRQGRGSADRVLPSLSHVARWSFRTLADPVRLAPVVMSLPPFRTAPNSGPLPSTGVTPRPRYYGPIRHPAGPACPSRGSGCRVHGTGGASRVATHSIFHTCRRHYPGGNRPVLSSLSSRLASGLPLNSGGSASATPVSRPARRSLAFRPAWSLSRPRRPFSPECFNPCRYLHGPPWLLPAGATVAGWDSHPPGKRAFPRRTEKSGLGPRGTGRASSPCLRLSVAAALDFAALARSRLLAIRAFAVCHSASHLRTQLGRARVRRDDDDGGQHGCAGTSRTCGWPERRYGACCWTTSPASGTCPPVN